MDERRVYKSRRRESKDMAKHHNYLCRMVKKSAREDKEKFIREICSGVERDRANNKIRAVYEGVRRITQTHAPRVGSIKDEHGKILTDQEDVKDRWKEYFNKLYNDPNKVDDSYLESIKEMESTEEEDLLVLGEDEVEAAIHKMKHGKAPGLDNVTTEEIQAGMEEMGIRIMHRLCQMVW